MLAGMAAISSAALVDRVVSLLLPPLCPVCRAPVDAPHRMCAACWRKIDFIAQPMCAACGLPFDHDPGPDAWCGECLRETPPFDRARAAVRYGDIPARVIIGFKHRDQTHLAPALSGWLQRAGRELLADADLLVPVPLYRWRLFRRRFNQAALLAHTLGRDLGLPVEARALRGLRPTRSQGGLTRAERLRNVRGAFAVDPERRDAIADRAVVLVDDVFTTGATIAACARALRRAGAARIDVLTLARVVRTD